MVKKKNDKQGAARRPGRAARRKPRRAITPGRAGTVLTLLGLFLTVLSLALSYSSSARSDIRAASCEFKLKAFEGQRDQLTGNDILRVVLVTRMKNYAVKGGYVSRFELAPTALGVTPDYRVTYLDHAALGWGEERDVEVHAEFTIDPKAHARLTALRQPLSLRLLGYDDTGRQITGESGEPFYIDLHLEGKLGASVAAAPASSGPARPS